MRIGLFSGVLQTCPPRGYGAEFATWDLAEGLSALGHEVWLAAPRGSRIPPRGRLIEVSLVPSDSIRSWITAEREVVRSLVREFQACDAVHDLSCSASLHDALGSSSSSICKHVYTQNGISWVSPSVVRDGVVVVSECARRLALMGAGEWYESGLDSGEKQEPLTPLGVVRYGCDLDFYQPVPPDRVQRDLVVYVGRPHFHKGIAYVAELARRRSDLTFVCAWRAVMRNHRVFEAEFLDQTRGIQNLEVILLPEDESHHIVKRDLMASASALLHPAVYVDACPRTVLEAQACGVPVLAFDRGGTPELVRNGATGILVPWNTSFPDAEAQDQLIRGLGVSLDRVRSLDRRVVRTYAVRNHGRVRMAQDYLRIYGRA